MRARRRVMVAAVAVALVVAGAAGAARMGVLTIGVGGGSHASATGIKVHGKWNLVVRTKNGKVVARRRFENSLTATGAWLLAGLLGHAESMGRWGVVINSEATAAEPDSQYDLATKNLAVTADISEGQVVLKGSVTNYDSWDPDGRITRVATIYYACPATVAPASCTTLPELEYSGFTSADLSPPVPVSQGEQVSVTVRFTFS